MIPPLQSAVLLGKIAIKKVGAQGVWSAKSGLKEAYQGVKSLVWSETPQELSPGQHIHT